MSRKSSNSAKADCRSSHSGNDTRRKLERSLPGDGKDEKPLRGILTSPKNETDHRVNDKSDSLLRKGAKVDARPKGKNNTLPRTVAQPELPPGLDQTEEWEDADDAPNLQCDICEH